MAQVVDLLMVLPKVFEHAEHIHDDGGVFVDVVHDLLDLLVDFLRVIHQDGLGRVVDEVEEHVEFHGQGVHVLAVEGRDEGAVEFDVELAQQLVAGGLLFLNHAGEELALFGVVALDQLLEVFGGNLCRLRLFGVGGEEVLLAAASSGEKVVQCHWAVVF